MHIYNDWRRDYTKAYAHSIGHGSFGKVSLVRSNDPHAAKYYAMKEIDLRQHILAASLINKSYALDEGLKLANLGVDHANIMRYYASYIHDEHVCWIMDYCDGGMLKERIHLYARRDKPLDEGLVWFWSLQLLEGVRYMHNKGIIHRDLKPDNIYIEGKRGTCKIGDFGFAKVLVESSITENTTVNFCRLAADGGKETTSGNSTFTTKENKQHQTCLKL